MGQEVGHDPWMEVVGTCMYRSDCVHDSISCILANVSICRDRMNTQLSSAEKTSNI